MKLLLPIAAALSISHAFGIQFIGPFQYHKNSLVPRTKGGKSALDEQDGSNQGGPQRDEIPKGKAPHTEEDVEQVKEKIEQNAQEQYSKGKQYKVQSQPAWHETGFTYDEESNIADLYFGRDMVTASDHVNYRNVNNPGKADKLWVPRPRNAAGKKAKDDKRRQSQRGLPKAKGTVLDEKEFAGVESDSDDPDGASVFYDTAKSQNKEGIMCGQAYDLVGKNGEDEDGNWMGKGGVRVHPNTDPSHERPVVGWDGVPGYPDPKIAMGGGSRSTIGQKRPAGSRGSSAGSSGSGKGSSTLVSKKDGRKAQKPNQKNKRGGIEQIAGPETAANSPASASNTSTDSSQDDLQAYLEAWDVIQINATNIVWRFLVDMISDSNSSEVYMAAWSIYSQLLYMPSDVDGPFYYGFQSLDWEEEQLRANPNITNDTLLDIYAAHDVLLDLYDIAWTSGWAALNASGSLDDLAWLAAVIDSYNDSSLPDSWTTVDASTYDDPFADSFLGFLNTTVPEYDLFIPSTASAYAMSSGTAIPMAAYPSAWSSGAPFPNNTDSDLSLGTSSSGVGPPSVTTSGAASSDTSASSAVPSSVLDDPDIYEESSNG